MKKVALVLFMVSFGFLVVSLLSTLFGNKHDKVWIERLVKALEASVKMTVLRKKIIFFPISGGGGVPGASLLVLNAVLDDIFFVNDSFVASNLHPLVYKVLL
jgi:hypothetical protein